MNKLVKVIFLSIFSLIFFQSTNAQSYTQEEQNCFDQVQNKVAYDQLGTKAWNPVNIRKLCKGTTNAAATISCFKNIISSFNDWNRGINECAGTQTTLDSETMARTITLKNNSGMYINGYLIRRPNYDDPRNQTNPARTNYGKAELIPTGQSKTFSGLQSYSVTDDIELWIIRDGGDWKPLFKATLPKNKDSTTFCYEVSGTYFVASVKTCDGSSTYESKYISFKNEAGYNSTMSLTYYPTGGSTPKTAKTISTTAGYQTKLYLPMDADTEKQMTLKVDMDGTGRNLAQTNISLSNFGSDCYKVWGDAVYPKISPCSLNPNARTIKLWNNSGFIATLGVTYYDKDQSGKDIGKTVSTNKLQLTQTETIEVPNGTSLTPLKIFIYNNYTGKTVLETTALANYTGELCYKVEGTSFAPTAATCDDTVGDTSGNTRQIRFQNEAGYDAQMIVQYFMDEVINGQKLAMPKILTTGMINGLGGKFRLVTIPKNTSKGMPITITLQGNATVKGNGAIFSTTLDANFAASPQQCFKVKGTLFDPKGGTCNQ